MRLIVRVLGRNLFLTARKRGKKAYADLRIRLPEVPGDL